MFPCIGALFINKRLIGALVSRQNDTYMHYNKCWCQNSKQLSSTLSTPRKLSQIYFWIIVIKNCITLADLMTHWQLNNTIFSVD